MQPNFVLIGADSWVLVYSLWLMPWWQPVGVTITIEQFRPTAAPARSLQLKGVYKDDQQAIAGERLRTLGYLRLAEKAWRREPHPPF